MGPQPEHYLETALEILSAGEERRALLDQLPVPIYTTDAAGAVTHWNRACVDFAGREPELGQDRWCITWQLYTPAGTPLRNEDCPVAKALQEKRPIRDAIAVCERPDGSRIAFRPYPTPLLDGDGNLTGAVNMLIDVSDEQSEALKDQAARCRRLASALYTRESSEVLERMASQFERTAQELVRNRDG